MAKYQLEANESIIMKSDGVVSGDKLLSGFFDGLILTNQNLIHIKRGVFGNIKLVRYLPLGQIKIYNNDPQVLLSKMSNGTLALEIYFQNRVENFRFQDGEKKGIIKWIHAISREITGQDFRGDFSSTYALSGTEEVAKTIKDTVDVFKTSLGFGTVAKETKVSIKCPNCSAPLLGLKDEEVLCSYCDIKQIL